MKRNHVPVRTCLVCRRKSPRRNLVRLGLDAQSGQIVVDVRATMKGRGAYVCPECLPDLRADRRMERAFKNRAKEIRVPDISGFKKII
ncbi:MAG: YlxR family protein [Syntrophobacteraceae bacterium]|nr:YlxR family protein [Syntrophobacteraceae bacterium]